MNTQSQGTGPGPFSKSQSEVQEFLVKRDRDGPLSFAGVLLAKATRQAGMPISAQILEAAVYQTRGGKYITALSKRFAVDPSLTAIVNALGAVEGQAGPDSGYNKAEVHDTFEAAMAWFRPGRLTDEIRKQLGLDQPVRIE
jgi:hypothetical protein